MDVKRAVRVQVTLLESLTSVILSFLIFKMEIRKSSSEASEN